MTDIDNNLEDWEATREGEEWSSILIGNGFSQNIWSRFAYHSLFDEAANGNGAQLSERDIALFDALETRNFEGVMSALSATKTVLGSLEQDSSEVVARESSIREALIRAVHSVHIPHGNVSAEILQHISGALSDYSAVYCTNYDLLTYWSVMHMPRLFKDYFFADEFDAANTTIWGKCTKVHYLHGGLHLYRRPNGQTLKRRAGEFQNLLSIFGTPYKDAVPLFVSEGTHGDKLASIYRSDYLSFALGCFKEDEAPLVVFGSSLGEVDQHILDAIAAYPLRPVAVSVRADGNIRQKKAAVIKELPDVKRIFFFDAASHPLGRAALTVAEE